MEVIIKFREQFMNMSRKTKILKIFSKNSISLLEDKYPILKKKPKLKTAKKEDKLQIKRVKNIYYI